MRRPPVVAISLMIAIGAVALATATTITVSVPVPRDQMKPEPSHPRQVRCTPQVSISGPVALAPVAPARAKVNMRKLPIARPGREKQEVPLAQIGSAQQPPAPQPGSAGFSQWPSCLRASNLRLR